jgi:hypothetical protein
VKSVELAAARPRHKGAADHGPHQLLLVEIGRVADLHQLPVTQHGDPVGDAEDLSQAVRHVDDGNAPVSQRANEGQQPVHVVLGQRGRRFVERQDPYARLEARAISVSWR